VVLEVQILASGSQFRNILNRERVVERVNWPKWLTIIRRISGRMKTEDSYDD
jgi:hypothetical protein